MMMMMSVAVEGGCAQLQTDFRIRQFSDLKAAASVMRPADWKACERCSPLASDDETAAATLTCSECREMLCVACANEHRAVEPTHSMVALNRRSCSRHPNRQIDVYCNDCDEPGCTACRIGPHHGHRVADLHQVDCPTRHNLCNVLSCNETDGARKCRR